MFPSVAFKPPHEGRRQSRCAGRHSCCRAFSGGMYVHDLSSQVSQEVKEAKADNVVTAVHLDTADGRLWTGHKRGYVRWAVELMAR